MATVASRLISKHDPLSGTPRAGFVDRWIYVFTAAFFIVITLIGFIPDSLTKIADVQAGTRPPFPFVLHLHAVLMGSFLCLLLTQTILMATGRSDLHMRVGIVAFIIAPALVIVGVILAPTMYHQTLNAFQIAPPEARARLQAALLRSENVKLLQLRTGLLFPLFLIAGLRARGRDAGTHKRMMMLATAIPISAAISRIEWIPGNFPASAVSTDLYTLLAVSPMFAWDVIRNHSVHKAYWIWFAVFLPFSVVVNILWDTPWWHAAARHMMGV